MTGVPFHAYVYDSLKGTPGSVTTRIAGPSLYYYSTVLRMSRNSLAHTFNLVCHTTTALFPQRCRPSLSLQRLRTEFPRLYSEASKINPPALSTKWTIGETILMTPTCSLSVSSQILPKAASKHQHRHVPVLPRYLYTHSQYLITHQLPSIQRCFWQLVTRCR
jgi:hypothetical protein